MSTFVEFQTQEVAIILIIEKNLRTALIKDLKIGYANKKTTSIKMFV